MTGAAVGPPSSTRGWILVAPRHLAGIRPQRQQHHQTLHGLLQAGVNLVAARAILGLALQDGILDIAGAPRELAQGEDRAAVRFAESPHRGLLRLGHGQDEGRFGEQISVTPEIGRGDGVLVEVDARLAQHEAGVERGQHAVAGDVAHAGRAHAHRAVHAPLAQHALEQGVGHHAAAGVGVTDEEHSAHGPLIARHASWPTARALTAPLAATARSAPRRAAPTTRWPAAPAGSGRSPRPARA